MASRSIDLNWVGLGWIGLGWVGEYASSGVGNEKYVVVVILGYFMEVGWILSTYTCDGISAFPEVYIGHRS